MDMSTIGYLLAVIGGFVGLAGWLSGRDERNIKSAEWRGEINGKLDAILGIDKRVDTIEKEVQQHKTSIEIISRDNETLRIRMNAHKEKFDKHICDGHGGK